MSHFLLLAAVTTLLLCPSIIVTVSSEAVLDVNGDPLIAGSSYYAMPLMIQNVGGLTMLDKENNTFCPFFYVAQTKSQGDYGIPLSFSPKNSKQKHVSLSSDLNIAFKYLSPSPLCRRAYSTVWQLIPDHVTENLYVALDGAKGNPLSWFKIEKNQFFGGYRIVFRRPDSTGEVFSGHVSILPDDQGRRLLGLDSANPPLVYPLDVAFVKA